MQLSKIRFGYAVLVGGKEVTFVNEREFKGWFMVFRPELSLVEITPAPTAKGKQYPPVCVPTANIAFFEVKPSEQENTKTTRRTASKGKGKARDSAV